MLKEKDFFIYLVLAVCPLLIWLEQTGSLAFYFSESVPDGQLIYVFSKLAGMYLVFLLWLQIFDSLKTDLVGMEKKSSRFHSIMGLSIVTLAVGHIILFFSAVTIRQGSPAWGVFWPGFKDYYHTYLMIGVFAFFALCGTALVGKLRKSRPLNTILGYGHKLYYVSLILAYTHAIAIGTEFQSLWGAMFYSALAVSLASLIFVRYWGRNLRRKAGVR